MRSTWSRTLAWPGWAKIVRIVAATISAWSLPTLAGAFRDGGPGGQRVLRQQLGDSDRLGLSNHGTGSARPGVERRVVVLELDVDA